MGGGSGGFGGMGGGNGGGGPPGGGGSGAFPGGYGGCGASVRLNVIVSQYCMPGLSGGRGGADGE